MNICVKLGDGVNKACQPLADQLKKHMETPRTMFIMMGIAALVFAVIEAAEIRRRRNPETTTLINASRRITWEEIALERPVTKGEVAMKGCRIVMWLTIAAANAMLVAFVYQMGNGTVKGLCPEISKAMEDACLSVLH